MTITPTSLTLNWGAASGIPTPTYITQWRIAASSTVGTPTQVFTSNPLGQTNSLSQLITGLLPSGTYDFRVQASNRNGITFSSVLTFTMPAATIVSRSFVASVEWSTPATESASGTSLTSTSGSILDAVGATWTLVSGTGLVVDRNGVAAGVSANVVLLLYLNHTVYQENSSNLWWSWSGTDWVPTTDPRVAPPTESADGTTITTTTGSIIDTAGTTWALVSGTGLQVSHNGTVDPNTPNTQLLLYSGHIVYYQTTGGNWFQWSGTAWVLISADPRIQIIFPGDAKTITDSNGDVWDVTAGGQVVRDGAVDTTTSSVTELVYVNGVIWRFVQSTGLWFFWGGASGAVNPFTSDFSSDFGAGTGWSPVGGTTVSPLGGVTRNPWDHPGGNGCGWNTPMGVGTTFLPDSDPATIDISRGWNGTAYTTGPVGIINSPGNFGNDYYIGKSTDPQFTFTTSNNGRTLGLDSGPSLTATLHVPNGSTSPGPFTGGDNPIVLYDPTNFPTRQYMFAVSAPPPGLQIGQGALVASAGEWDDATSDNYGEDAETGLDGYNQGAGLITGYDTDPSRNPAYPKIRHGFRYSTDAHLLKSNATVAGGQILKPNSWPQRLQDGQSGVNLYSGNLTAGATLAIPLSTAQPPGLNANQAGLFWSMQHYPSYFRDQAGGGFHYSCDQVADTSQWMTDARAILPTLTALLRVVSNQHQTGQSFATFPKNGPGARSDVGPPPLSAITPTPPPTTAPPTTTPPPTITPPTGTPTVVESVQGAVVTTTGPVLRDASLESFGISGGQVVANTVVDATTSNVVSLLYWNHSVYQVNTAGGWYFKSAIANPWQGPTTDPRITSAPVTPGSKPRIVAPLTGTVLIGQGANSGWVAVDITVPGVQLPSGKPVHFCYLLPHGYDPTKIYPVLYWLHPDFSANAWYQGQAGATDLCFADANGFYNTVQFRTDNPCIVVVGFADQTTGNDAIDNWGGWFNNGTVGTGTHASGDTGPNVFGLLGVDNWVNTNLSADVTRKYIWGFSLGAIGAEWLMLKYNTVNGNPKVFTAAGSVAGVIEGRLVNNLVTAADLATMRNVPVWWVSGASDDQSFPSHWNDLIFTGLGGSSFPAPGGTEAQARAGTSLMHYWRDPAIGHQQTNSAGAPYPTNTTIMNYLFAQIAPGSSTPPPTTAPSGPESASGTLVNTLGGQVVDQALTPWTLVNPNQATLGLQIAHSGVLDTTTSNVVFLGYFNHTVYQSNTAGNWYSWTGTAWVQVGDPRGNQSGIFQVGGGKILTPGGAVFKAKGINANVEQGSTISTSTAGAPLLTLFPGTNCVRVPFHSYLPPSSISTFVAQMTALKIVVIIEDHTGISQQPYTGAALQTELNWYISMAQFFLNNPYVWYGTFNEPYPQNTSNGDDVTTQHLAIYNAIRGTGNNNPILLELIGGGNPPNLPGGGSFGLTKARYITMRNVVWDYHQYGWTLGGVNVFSTDPTVAASSIQGYINQVQQITSADGVVPVIIGEFGNSTDGSTTDVNGAVNVNAVGHSGYGFLAWAWSAGGSSDNLTSGGQITSYGSQVAQLIASQ